MSNSARTAWKIAITGSAGVGKTSLVEMLVAALDLPYIKEEMRAYLERTRVHLWELPPAAVMDVIVDLWRERTAKEASTEAFVADNCALDFVAYALHYGCFTEEVAATLLPEVLNKTARYDAVFVLPWGVLPYVEDGIRSPDHFGQLGYQLIIEGLLQRYVDWKKVHYLPIGLNDRALRFRWARSVLDGKKVVQQKKTGPEWPALEKKIRSHISVT